MILQYITDSLGERNAVILSMIDCNKIEKERQELEELRKYKKINIALAKLQKILNLTNEIDKEKARIELSKMIPKDESASVIPKIGWGYHDDLIQTGTSFKITPYFSTNKKISFFDLYKNLLKISDYKFMDSFIEGFDIILAENPEEIKIGILPATEIANKTKAIHINFKIII